MYNRKLKNYHIYLKRLKLFAEAMAIKVEYGDLDTEGVWIPNIRTIRLCEDELSQSMEVACLLHELGHSLDDLLRPSKKIEKLIYNIYEKFYQEKATKKEKDLVIKFEKRAWKNGRDIAYRLRIPLGKWYDSAEQACLYTYRNA